jgi:hypothetical protein
MPAKAGIRWVKGAALFTRRGPSLRWGDDYSFTKVTWTTSIPPPRKPPSQYMR